MAVHLASAAALFYLLSFRDIERPREVEIPVEIVTEAPDAPKPGAAAAKPPGPVQQASSPPVAPDPKPPAPPQVQPSSAEAPRPVPRQSPSGEVPEPPKLVAPPPEPTRAATQDRDTKAANLEPDQHQADQAIREAKPVAAPQVLTTSDPKAGFAVPPQAELKPDAIEKPAPPIPAKAPSETEKLAAALPMDMAAMPMTFRAVLAGNGAQVTAAYKGLVYGRFSRNPEIGERAHRQHLKGQVILAFTIGDAGQLTDLAVAKSSGTPAVDALGLEMIRAAAPFPPPPTGAQRSFTPALTFGD